HLFYVFSVDLTPNQLYTLSLHDALPISELLGEVLARSEAGVDVERLHEIDDRGAPFQLFALVRGGRRVDDRGNIHGRPGRRSARDRKSTRLNSSHSQISYAVFCLKKKNL